MITGNSNPWDKDVSAAPKFTRTSVMQSEGGRRYLQMVEPRGIEPRTS